jgi:hypothetical protein
MGDLNFNTTENEVVSFDYSPLPPGRYRAEVTETEVRENKKGTGDYLYLVFSVLDEEFRGKKIFCNLTLNHPNEKAQKIGRGQLSALCQACGKSGMVEDSASLWHIPVVLSVGVETGTDGVDRNTVKGFYSNSEESAKKQAYNFKEAKEKVAAKKEAAKAEKIAKDLAEDEIPW